MVSLLVGHKILVITFMGHDNSVSLGIRMYDNVNKEYESCPAAMWEAWIELAAIFVTSTDKSASLAVVTDKSPSLSVVTARSCIFEVEIFPSNILSAVMLLTASLELVTDPSSMWVVRTASL